MDAATRTVFLSELEWFTLPGGVTLFEEHEPSDAFYIVIAGCLGVIGSTSAGTDQLIARVGTGESIGELGLLGGRPRAMTVVALRDTSLLRMSQQAFETLSERDPRAMLQLIVQFFAWLQWPPRARTDLPAPKTIALIPLGTTVRIGAFARSLSRQLIVQGVTATIVDTGIAETEPSFAALEAAHSLVIYQGEALDSNWTQLCLRRADRILLVPGAIGDAGRHPAPARAENRRAAGRVSHCVCSAGSRGAVGRRDRGVPGDPGSDRTVANVPRTGDAARVVSARARHGNWRRLPLRRRAL